MDTIKDAFNAEIESLKKTISEQADLLRTQERKAEEVQKSHERATVSMREELDLLAGELDLIDVELRSKFLIFVPPALLVSSALSKMVEILSMLQILTDTPMGLGWNSYRQSTST
jgi:hypothetical protein